MVFVGKLPEKGEKKGKEKRDCGSRLACRVRLSY